MPIIPPMKKVGSEQRPYSGQKRKDLSPRTTTVQPNCKVWRDEGTTHSSSPRRTTPRDKGERSPRYSAGKASGSDRPDNVNYLRKLVESSEMRSYEDVRAFYAYDNIRIGYNWANDFRAGFAVIYQDPTNCKHCELLMVQQKPENGTTIAKIGPPKGSVEKNDISALDTATRELREETAIDLFDPKLNAKLLLSVCMSRRPEDTVEELIIYFMVVVNSKPEVVIDTNELIGHTWIDMSKGFKRYTNVTTPTRQLLDLLENMDVFTAPTVYGKFPINA